MDGTKVRVEAVREVGPETVAIELETPESFDALPGQFVLLRAAPEGEELARHYTLSSATVTDTFEITVGIDPDGDLSPWLADLEGGETVHVEGPMGAITYEGAEDVVAVAGGPGVGPAVAIAEFAHKHDQDASVIYQDDEPAHRDRLEALEAEGAAVSIVDADSNEELEEAVADHLDDGQFYVFGFSDFVTTIAERIDEVGGNSDDALIENFG
ncbi:FAD-dependent oxidoreductase [Halostagnicola sp. A-GB9-2]|uniref:ferredoxin--NADP reductase n=1 Tax=Halostagnicola sp. A-GB9-2 TaxID=3048066 RepID=UPI0024BF4CA4|nr:FAD-dependent oxidoreductase [Halostagnicola sp. A-GB9-2]MDJ1434448.1 FAD-dependent oxidoreductase [Halostagnicola sp. A-GB9-2]